MTNTDENLPPKADENAQPPEGKKGGGKRTRKAKATESEASAQHDETHDMLGRSVLYTPKETEAATLAERCGIKQKAFAAMVIGADESGALTLQVFVPGRDPWQVSGVTEDEDPTGKPHSWRI